MLVRFCAATYALFEREDVIIVASVSCIYGLGSPEQYKGMQVYGLGTLTLDAGPRTTSLICLPQLAPPTARGMPAPPLPCLCGRVPISAGQGMNLSNRALGAKGGEENPQAQTHYVLAHDTENDALFTRDASIKERALSEYDNRAASLFEECREPHGA